MYDCVLPLNQHFLRTVNRSQHALCTNVMSVPTCSITSAQSLLSVPFVIFTEMAIKSNSLRCVILLHLHAAPLA